MKTKMHSLIIDKNQEFVICHQQPQAVLRVVDMGPQANPDISSMPNTWAMTRVCGHDFALQIEEFDTQLLPEDNSQCTQMLRDILLSAADFLHQQKTILYN